MGAKYRARYQQHFAHPVLHEQNLQHEELLACHPEQWAHLVKKHCIVNGKTYLEQAGFCKIQNHKNKKGWLCITAQK